MLSLELKRALSNLKGTRFPTVRHILFFVGTHNVASDREVTRILDLFFNFFYQIYVTLLSAGILQKRYVTPLRIMRSSMDADTRDI